MTDKAEITEQEILERLAHWVVERRMTAPAILFLESHRPLSFIGSQAMIVASPIVQFFEPFLKSLIGPGFGHNTYERFASMMEDRDNLERLIIEIERENQDVKERERGEKLRRKALKKEAKEKRKALRRSAGRTPSQETHEQ